MTNSMQPDSAPPEKAASRLMAFSDGVFAIAVTLLVLDIRVPSAEKGKAGSLL